MKMPKDILNYNIVLPVHLSSGKLLNWIFSGIVLLQENKEENTGLNRKSSE